MLHNLYSKTLIQVYNPLRQKEQQEKLCYRQRIHEGNVTPLCVHVRLARQVFIA